MITTGREFGIEVEVKKVMGLSLSRCTAHESAVRPPDERRYDYRYTASHLEKAINLFETVVESMLELAALESKLKRLGEEIRRITRRIRVLEEKSSRYYRNG